MDKNKKAEYLINKWSKQHSLNSRELSAIWDRSKELTSKKTRKAVSSFSSDEWNDALNFFRTMVGEEFNIPLTKLTEKVKMSEDKTTKLKLNKSYILEDVVVKANTPLVVLNEELDKQEQEWWFRRTDDVSLDRQMLYIMFSDNSDITYRVDRGNEEIIERTTPIDGSAYAFNNQVQDYSDLVFFIENAR